ncbi:TRAP transporter large permease [Cupriavidus numazuensis]|uniref:TRAP transporter large permease protein n=1 Tax=Cupriavidus numazuensis TaxID=221992 RepID=A0ABM8TLB2_9BURK|nr:TRAP transporter large permease [Cupriavidus numazuensis]CAG2153167.1 Sialic acid TRAP transporter large permease protein SiaM [Cupriavidus numazuensis]
MNLVLAASFVGLMGLGVPIAFAMLIAGLLAVAMQPSLSGLVVVQNLFSGLDSFPLLAMPFFILAAELMSGGALTDVLLTFAARLVGKRRGGLGHANILTLTFFSGISGSALADAAGPGAMLIRMMKRAGYSDAYAAALTASTAIVGPIIPPSIIMIIYSLTDDGVTMTGLFLAGIVPGLLIAASLVVVNHIVSVRRNYRSSAELLDPRPLFTLFLRALPALMLPFIILGGIHFGIFTPTEASAVAVFYALLVGRFVYKTLHVEMLPAILFRTALMTASILFIVGTSAVFAWMLTVGQIPQLIGTWIAGLHLSPIELLLAVNVLLLLVGIFIEPLPGVMIMVPILAPLADAAGIAPLQFAIVVIVNLTLGMITPPVGGLLFVTSVVSEVPMGRMVREMKGMLIALLSVLMLLTYVPALSTWLPGVLGYAR